MRSATPAGQADATLTPATPIDAIPGIGPAYAARLHARGLANLGDLLGHFPQRYLDPRQTGALEPGAEGIFPVTVERWSVRRHFARRLSVLHIETTCGTTPLRLVIFNRPYLARQLAKGRPLRAWGCLGPELPLTLLNPMLLPEESIASSHLWPLYPPLAGIPGGLLRRAINAALDRLSPPEDTLPPAILKRDGWPAPLEAWRLIHRPESEKEAWAGKRRFIFDELLEFQLELEQVRRHFKRQPRLCQYRKEPALMAELRATLPFSLTKEQEHAWSEISADLQGKTVMQRLLQGDVGSGKTALAMLGLRWAALSGFQAVMLCPTAVLAAQHAAVASTFLGGIPHALLTGATPAAQRRTMLKEVQAGQLKVLFGTHALLDEALRFANLSLCVIDEQHRFGAAQRARLCFKGSAVDILVTTATPIPRTLRLGLYSDLALSTLHHGPAGRQPIRTRIVTSAEREAFFTHLQRKVEQGWKGYIVVPLIEPSETFPDLANLADAWPELMQRFSGLPIAMLSGKSAHPEKSQVLADFRSGKVRILVATTVIEVGIDVNDAVFMAIENADRFGLATLHQLRGRVGRGGLEARCYLLASPQPTPQGYARLEALRAHSDGFAIAEADLTLRGPGTVTDALQSGQSAFRWADAERDHELLTRAGNDAAAILDHAGQSPWDNAWVEAIRSRAQKKTEHINFS